MKSILTAFYIIYSKTTTAVAGEQLRVQQNLTRGQSPCSPTSSIIFGGGQGVGALQRSASKQPRPGSTHLVTPVLRGVCVRGTLSTTTDISVLPQSPHHATNYALLTRVCAHNLQRLTFKKIEVFSSRCPLTICSKGIFTCLG